MEDKSAARAPSATAATSPAEPAHTISIEDLADKLYRKRKGRGLTLEQAGQQIGVSAATLSRLERQRNQDRKDGDGRGPFVPDIRTLTAITRWLDMQLGQVVGDSTPELASGVVHRKGESVPDMVEAHLRADRNLDDESALALTQMFRMAYDQFSRLRQTQAATNRPTERADNDE